MNPITWERLPILITAICWMLAGPAHVSAEWVKIDDFQSCPPDNLPTESGGWTVLDAQPTQAMVSADRNSEGNQAVKVQRRSDIQSQQHDVLCHTGAVDIAPGGTGTVFLRFMIESGLDKTLGSTTGEQPVESVSLKIALTERSLHAGNGRVGIWINGLNAGAYGIGPHSNDVVRVQRNRWYCLWLVVDNSVDGQKSAAYLQEEGKDEAPYAVPGELWDPSSNRGSSMLTAIGVVKSKDCGLTDVWLDDLHVDNSGINLSNPLESTSAVDWKQKLEQEAQKYRHLLTKAATWEQAGKQARELLAAMTPEERFALVCGDGSVGISGFARLGIPPVLFSDASAGINNDPAPVRRRHAQSVAYPCLLLLTATWSPELARAYSQAIGEECRSGATHVLLGPGMNLYRCSSDGRNFEFMGEDPFLAGHMIEAFVRGLQSTGTGATLKHLVGNEMEFHRRGSNSIIDERTLNEVYLGPFRVGIDAGALAVMTAYNQLNGEWCGQNKYVNMTLLREQLGFQGISMTDWIATYDGVQLAQSGTDLEMPGGWALKKDRAKVFGSPDIDRMAFNVLKTCIFGGFYEKNYAKPEWTNHRSQWEQTALQVNHEGIVLLQNNGILPLSVSGTGKTILLAGNNVNRAELSGGGSGHVKGYNLRTYAQAVTGAFADAKVICVEKPTDDQIRAADLVLLFPGFPQGGTEAEGEGRDRSFVLPDDGLIARCAGLNPRTVVCLTAGGGVQMEWADKTAAVIHAFYGGQTAAPALLDILTGKVNPSGKLPFTIERRIEDSPGFETTHPKPDLAHSYPATMFSEMVQSNFFSSPDKSQYYICDINYREGVFVGYRWYDKNKLPVRFPFGHGLSYTTFAYGDLKVEKTGAQNARVRFTLKNTGARAGAEVAQIYVSDGQSSIPRPLQELKGFQKVLLQPGESREVTVDLDRVAFQFWNPETKRWTVEPGDFEIRVGASSSDIHDRAGIRLEGEFATKP